MVWHYGCFKQIGMTENKRVRQYKTHLSSSFNWEFNLSWWHSWKSTLCFISVKDRVRLETPLFGHNTVIIAAGLVLPSNLGNWLKKKTSRSDGMLPRWTFQGYCTWHNTGKTSHTFLTVSTLSWPWHHLCSSQNTNNFLNTPETREGRLSGWSIPNHITQSQLNRRCCLE